MMILRTILKYRSLRFGTVGFTVHLINRNCRGLRGYLDRLHIIESYREGRLLEILRSPDPGRLMKPRVKKIINGTLFEQPERRGACLVIRLRRPMTVLL